MLSLGPYVTYCRSCVEERAIGQSEEAGPCAVKDIGSSGSEEEVEDPNFNILNNSLVEIYMNERNVIDGGVAQGDVIDVGVTQSDVIENVRADDDEHTVDISNPLMSCDDHVIHSETSSHDSRDWPCPHSSNQPPETGKPPTTTKDCSSHLESAGSAVVEAKDDVNSLLVKKVSFSIPEVTSQHDYVASEECKMRRIRRKKSRRHDDESSKSKRKRTNEDPSPSDHMKQVKSSGWLICLWQSVVCYHIAVLRHSVYVYRCVL